MDMIVQKNVSVTTTVAELLPNQTTGERIVWRVRKATGDTETITLGLDQDAVSGNGIVLGPGETEIDSNSEQYKCFQGRMTIVGSGSTTVSLFARSKQ